MSILSEKQIYDAMLPHLGTFASYEDLCEAAYRETLKMVARLNKFPQCKGIVITVEDWEALNKLEVSNEH
ncbi:hypothetical protein LCGC14_2850830 [marine sediment metagenome]|uniref:Uncharacterized protein n=1 Tax=marine sediment metagenome TaxID=412755 RepID=A0A0F9AGQ1_9ZZZZ